ncbi:hypothetical protein KEG38_15695 [Polyangium jinanense]|uniref:hypothetical protein n=1 Tax=Polyangium jinanense TaxID=2829994 RepID=UPI0023420321|nr:hypothetical protein [Polyangium jinanense]MDC3955309.1 hypothetical protein [Polyangium jinanense]
MVGRVFAAFPEARSVVLAVASFSTAGGPRLAVRLVPTEHEDPPWPRVAFERYNPLAAPRVARRIEAIHRDLLPESDPTFGDDPSMFVAFGAYSKQDRRPSDSLAHAFVPYAIFRRCIPGEWDEFVVEEVGQLFQPDVEERWRKYSGLDDPPIDRARPASVLPHLTRETLLHVARAPLRLPLLRRRGQDLLAAHRLWQEQRTDAARFAFHRSIAALHRTLEAPREPVAPHARDAGTGRARWRAYASPLDGYWRPSSNSSVSSYEHELVSDLAAYLAWYGISLANAAFEQVEDAQRVILFNWVEADGQNDCAYVSCWLSRESPGRGPHLPTTTEGWLALPDDALAAFFGRGVPGTASIREALCRAFFLDESFRALDENDPDSPPWGVPVVAFRRIPRTPTSRDPRTFDVAVDVLVESIRTVDDGGRLPSEDGLCEALVAHVEESNLRDAMHELLIAAQGLVQGVERGEETWARAVVRSVVFLG